MTAASEIAYADARPPLLQLQVDKSQTRDLALACIHVAEYITELPPPDVLRKRLHEAVRAARARLEATAAELSRQEVSPADQCTK